MEFPVYVYLGSWRIHPHVLLNRWPTLSASACIYGPAGRAA